MQCHHRLFSESSACDPALRAGDSDHVATALERPQRGAQTHAGAWRMAGRTLCAGAPHACSSRCVYPRCLSPPGGTCSARLCVSPSPVLTEEPGPGTHRHGMSVDVRVTGTHASCSRPHGWAHTHGNRVRLGRPLLRAQVSASESSAVTCRDPTLRKHLRVPLFPGFRTLPSRRATSDGGERSAAVASRRAQVALAWRAPRTCVEMYVRYISEKLGERRKHRVKSQKCT